MTGNEVKVAEPTGESEPQGPGAQWSQRPELGWDGLGGGGRLLRDGERKRGLERAGAEKKEVRKKCVVTVIEFRK